VGASPPDDDVIHVADSLYLLSVLFVLAVWP